MDAAFAGWHEWNQMTRNQAIVDRTYQDNGSYVGKNCKEWVRQVVKDASGQLVNIPSTQPNLYEWYPNPYVVKKSLPIEYASPGEIVQMKLKSGTEHTAIVLARSSLGITFIESN